MPSENQPKSNNQPSRRGGRRPGAGRPRGKPALPPKANIKERNDIADAAKAYAEYALQALIDVATNGKSESARVTAATALLERGYGRPRQAVEHSGPQGGPIEVHIDQLRDRLASRVAGLATRMGTNGDHPATNGNGAHRP